MVNSCNYNWFIVLGGYSWVKGFYNTAIQLNENVAEAWGNVQTSYQEEMI